MKTTLDFTAECHFHNFQIFCFSTTFIEIMLQTNLTVLDNAALFFVTAAAVLKNFLWMLHENKACYIKFHPLGLVVWHSMLSCCLQCWHSLWVLVQVQVAPLSIQLPVYMPRKAAEDGLGPWVHPSPAITATWTVSQRIDLSWSLCLFATVSQINTIKL